MKKNSSLILVILVVLCISTACENLKIPTAQPTLQDLTPQKAETPVKKDKTPIATLATSEEATPFPTTIPTKEPTLLPETMLVSIEMQPDVWFTFPSKLWSASDDPVFPYLQSEKFPECRVFLNNGHGMPDTMVVNGRTETIGGVEFQVDEWSYLGTPGVVLKAYAWEDNFLFTVESPSFSVLDEQCLAEAEDVLRYSINMAFGPYSSENPAGSVLPPVVYSKEGNIYAYFTKSGVIVPVTEDGWEVEGDELIEYTEPRVSPNGRFVAYEQQFRGEVHLYSFETGMRWVVNLDKPDDVFIDSIMGWDENNMLYISRVIGTCDIMQEVPQGPHTTQILRFDISQEKLEFVAEIPKNGPEPDSYSMGLNISPTGRYLTFLAKSCDSQWTEVQKIYDVQTGEIRTPETVAEISISNQETSFAFSSARSFNENQNVHVVIADMFAGGGAWVVDQFQDTHTVWSNPKWSFDDHYLVISQNAIEDPEMNEFSPFIWWVLGNTGLVLINASDSSAPPIAITELNAETESWTFGAWSPVSYQMVLIEGQSKTAPTSYSRLWIIEPFSNTALLIDEGEFILSADW